MNIIDAFFTEFQEISKINTQRGYSQNSKPYPLLVFHILSKTPFTYSYDKNADYTVDKEIKRIFQTTVCQVSLISTNLDSLVEFVIPAWREFVFQNNIFKYKDGQSLVQRPLGNLNQMNFFISDNIMIHQYTQDVEFNTRIIVEKSIEYIDMDLSVDQMQIDLNKGGNNGHNPKH